MNLIVTTTHSVEGYAITEYLGAVFGAHLAIEGAFTATGRNEVLRKALHSALAELVAEASTLGANAVVGVCFAATPGVLVSGTAVRLAPQR